MASKPDAAQAAPEPDPTPAVAPALPALDANAMAVVAAFAQQLLAGQQALTAENLKAQADAYAASMKVAMRPENADPPLISDFNPEGDRDHPRPVLPYPVTMNGAELPPELLTVEELRLLAQIEPGAYRVTKTDDTTVVVRVVPTVDSATNAITKMNIVSKFGNKRNPGDKDNWPPMRVWLAEMLGVPAPQRARETLPTGRLSGPPQLGAAANVHGVITGDLAQHKDWLGPMAGPVEAMLASPSSAI